MEKLKQLLSQIVDSQATHLKMIELQTQEFTRCIKQTNKNLIDTEKRLNEKIEMLNKIIEEQYVEIERVKSELRRVNK